MKKRYLWIGSLLLVFIITMIMVLMGYSEGIDTFIYNLVSTSNSSLVNIWKYITFLGSTKFIIFLCVFFLLFYIIIKKKWNGIYVDLSLIVSTVLNNVIKIIICRERPDVTRYVVETSYSFPSGHAMASTMMYGLLSYYVYKSNLNKYVKVLLMSLLYLIIILVSISRIILGAHFVTDVFAGIVLSSALLIIMISIMEKRRRI